MAWPRRKTGCKFFGIGRAAYQSERSFPTDRYLTPVDTGAGETTEGTPAQGGALCLGERGPHSTAIIDSQVMRGPTQADRDNLPYVQEAWEWATRATRAIGLRRRNKSYPCVLDILTRMRVAALIERRNLAWPETAAKVAGADPEHITATHDVLFGEVHAYLSRARELLEEGLDDGWDGVVWGDIDPHDPQRTLEIDREICEDCGRCVVVCPQVFAKSADGEVSVKSPTAVRDRELEESCMEALAQCRTGAARLNSRGGRTATGALPPRGRPLPGEMKAAADSGPH